MSSPRSEASSHRPAMPADRRIVRVTSPFFDQLDRQLAPERGPAGEPSATDFLVIDLPPIVERFASEFDQLPEAVTGVPALRVLIEAGSLVRAVAVYGVLGDDDSVELVGVELDVRP